MTDASTSIVTVRPQPTVLDRAASWASWLLACAIFLTVGWMAMAPDDPLGAVSVLTRRHPSMMLLQAAGLAGVTAALATVLTGRRLPYAGTFAAAVGLAAVSLRGGTTAYLLLQGADAPTTSQSVLAGKLALEAVEWFAILMIAHASAVVVARWCHGVSSEVGASRPPAARVAPAGGARLPFFLQHAVLATGASLVVFHVLSGGWTSRSIQHGQACFVVAATVCIAAYPAYRVAPLRTPLASLIAVGLLALLGYLWAGFRSPPQGLPACIPASPVLGVLPIQFICVGGAAAVAMFWYMCPAGNAAHATPVEEPH